MDARKTIALLSVVGLYATAGLAAETVIGNAQNPIASKPRTADRTVLDPVSRRFLANAGDEVPAFRKHVVPLLGKLGCNGRACHGSFQGRGGFHLSLFGYDFKMDHQNLLAGDDEPRVNVKNPEASLVLQKPTLRIPHEGGLRYKLGSWEHHVLLKWIQSGAAGTKDSDPNLKRLEITPAEIHFTKKGEHIPLRAVACWSDGAREDVTPLCRFQSNDEQIATIDAQGVVASVDAGDSHVVVFYDSGVVPVPVMRPVSDTVGPRYPDVATPTEIDRLVVKKLRKLGIVPSETCTDAEFLRRVSLDLTGTLPTAEEVALFLADKSSDKRSKKTDELLERPTYAAWWTTRLCDITGNNDSALVNISPVKQSASQEWYDWILRRVTANVPYDKLVEGIILANSRRTDQTYGEYAREMSALYWPHTENRYADRPSLTHFWARRTVAQPQQKALSFAYTFLGIRIQCAECHKHPFDQWTQDDYKDFTKFFAPIRYGVAPSDKSDYDSVLAELKTTQKQLNDLRKEYPRMLAEKKTLPFLEVFVAPINRRNPVRAQRPQSIKPQAFRLAARMRPQLKRGRRPVVAQRPHSATPIDKLASKPKKLDPSADKTAGQTKPGAEKRRPAVAMRPVPKRPNRRLARRRPQPDPNAKRARLLGAERVDLSSYDDPREALMNWLRSKSNRYFARSFVNRVWATYFNVGIVNPPDDLSLANPPSNAELLDYLAEGFVKHGYDMKWLHREIVNSRTYQLSWRPNATNGLDQRNFSHAVLRRLPAEVAYDAVRQATSSDAVVGQMQKQWLDRAIGVPGSGRRGRGGSIYALNVFGRSVRQSNCDCDRSDDPSLLQTVFLRNDNEVLAMVSDPRFGWINQIAKELAPRPARPQAKKSPVAKSPATRPQSAKNGVRPRPVDDRMLTAEQRTRLISRLTERLKQLETAKKTGQAKQLAERIQQLKRHSADGRRPVVAMRPRSKVNARPKGARPQPAALRFIKSADVSADRKAGLVRTAYLRTLSRYPDNNESARALAYLNGSDNVIGGLRDLMWALVNTREFIVNH